MNLKNLPWKLLFFLCLLVSICESICWFHSKNNALVFIFVVTSPKRKNILLFIIATSINLLLLLLQSIAAQWKIST